MPTTTKIERQSKVTRKACKEWCSFCEMEPDFGSRKVWMYSFTYDYGNKKFSKPMHANCFEASFPGLQSGSLLE